MKELRIVQKMDENGSFNSIRMGDLKKGDTFRIFETQEDLDNKNGGMWKATDNGIMLVDQGAVEAISLGLVL